MNLDENEGHRVVGSMMSLLLPSLSWNSYREGQGLHAEAGGSRRHLPYHHSIDSHLEIRQIKIHSKYKDGKYTAESGAPPLWPFPTALPASHWPTPSLKRFSGFRSGL
jgi:hypothetical protein